MAVDIQAVNKLQDSAYIRRELGIDVKWRILTSKGGKARIVAYQDSRDVQNALDGMLGSSNWTNEARNINGKLYMAIGISIQGEGWVYKMDVGVETSIEAVKGEASDALKRAAVMWGLFRDCYQMEYIVLDVNGKDPVTPDGEILRTPDAIAAYCNSISAPMGYLKRYYNSVKSVLATNQEAMNALKVLTNFTKEL